MAAVNSEKGSNLLPHARDDFRSKRYWEDFFKKRKSVFEWYGTFSKLRPALEEAIGSRDQVLVVGCGNSELSAQIHKHIAREIVNIDFSERVINTMQKKYRTLKEMKWLVMDMTKMSFEDGTFNAVVDKGSLDALASSDNHEVYREVCAFFAEIKRVLCLSGKYICITLGQNYLLKWLLEHFPASDGFVVEVDTTAEDDSDSHYFPLVVTVTKQKALQVPQTFFNVRFHFSEAGLRNSSHKKLIVGRDTDSIEQFVESARSAFRVRQDMGTISPDASTDFELRSKLGNIRFILTVLDVQSADAKPSCAVFIVPHGRESEWIFSSREGMQQLAETAQVQRLIVVKMVAGEEYGSLSDVQEEISPAVHDFAPRALRKQRLPVMSVENSLGIRKEVFRGTLEGDSGPFLVEDVASDSSEFQYRRLVFLKNPCVIQSEARLSKSGALDPSYLCFEYHRAMLAGFSSLCLSGVRHALVIGLGGGALALALQQCFLDLHVTVVELDANILRIAQKFFSFPELEDSQQKLRVCIDDGIAAVESLRTAFDLVVVDVDNKDLSVGMSCPPSDFLTAEFLGHARRLLTDSKGCFCVNLAARSRDAFRGATEAISDAFGAANVRQLKPVSDDVNTVLFATVGRLPPSFDGASTSLETCPSLAEDEDMLELARRLTAL